VLNINYSHNQTKCNLNRWGWICASFGFFECFEII